MMKEIIFDIDIEVYIDIDLDPELESFGESEYLSMSNLAEQEIEDRLEEIAAKFKSALGVDVVLTDHGKWFKGYTDKYMAFYTAYDDHNKLTVEKIKKLLGSIDLRDDFYVDEDFNLESGEYGYEPVETTTRISLDCGILNISKSIEDNKVENKKVESHKIISYRCPACRSKTLYPVNGNVPAYGDLCICSECSGEFLAYPEHNGTMRFVEDSVD